MSNSLIDALNWRYATKEFDPNKPLDPAKLDTLLEATRLSASSFGLQFWHFICLRNQELRNSLIEHSYGQKQVADCGALIVMCRPNEADEAGVDRFLESTAETRGVSIETLSGYGEFAKSFMGGMSPRDKQAWMKNQVYLALGNLLTAAAVEGIDACPMEGFLPTEYDRILGLEEKGLRSVVCCALGHRADSDKYATEAKVRYPASQVISYMD